MSLETYVSFSFPLGPGVPKSNTASIGIHRPCSLANDSVMRCSISKGLTCGWPSPCCASYSLLRRRRVCCVDGAHRRLLRFGYFPHLALRRFLVKLIQECHSPYRLNDFALSGAKILNKIESKYNNKEILYEQENHHHHSARPRRNGGAGADECQDQVKWCYL